MPQAKPLFNNFTAGEISPRSYGDVDRPFYFKGARTIENYMIAKLGGLYRRPGWYYLGSTTSNAKARLIPFRNASGTWYVLEFTNANMQVWKVSTHAVVSATNLAPWLLADLPNMKFSLSLGTMYVNCPGYATRKITTSADATWTITTETWTIPVGNIDFTSSADYARACAFYEGRFSQAGFAGHASFVQLSKSPNATTGATQFTDFTLGISDGDAISVTTVDMQGGRVLWALGGARFVIGTDVGVFVVDQGTAMTPTTAAPRIEDDFGCADIQGVKIGSTPIYVQRDKKHVRTLEYGVNSDGSYSYSAKDMTLLADHITGSGVVDIAVQRIPEPIAWFVTSAGYLAALTYDRENGIAAWHRHTTKGTVEAVCVVPGAIEDEVWLVVNRTVGGSTVRYVEYMLPRDFGTDQKDAIFVDAAITIDGGAAVAISGVTKAGPAVVTATGHGFSNNDLVKIAGVVGMTEINDHVYMVKNKTINTFELYIEDGTSAVNSTSFTAYTSGGTAQKVYKTVTGLAHLEGLNVHVLADGAVQADEDKPKTVASGAITLDAEANRIQVGVGYISKVLLPKLDINSVGGTTIGDKKHIDQLIVRIYQTLGMKVGPSYAKAEAVTFRTAADLMDNPIALSDEDILKSFPGKVSSSGDVMLIQDQPLPSNILAVVARIRIE